MILFKSTEKNFSNNGLGVLHPLKCLETKKKSLNGWYIECELPIKYKDVIKQDMILFVETKEKGGQPFRCNNVDYTDRKISITANHVMFDSERYILDDVRPTLLSPVSFLKWINERTDNISPFSVSSNVSGSGTKYFIRKTLLEAWKTTEELFGGSFDADKYDVRLLSKVGNDDGFCVSYGKNIQSVSIIEDWSSVCTKVMPVGPDGLLLPEKYLTSDVKYEQPYTKVVDFDIPTSYENESGETVNYTNEELVIMLRSEAQEYIKTAHIPLINYSVKSDVPQKLRIGDIIHVKHPILTINTEVQEYQYDTISKRVKSLVFGNYERDVKKAFDSIKDAITEASKNASGALKEAIKQSDLINQLNKNGLVYIDDNEILILDKLPKEEADQVWRFGLGGLGFSSNGYKGPFKYALTQDGHFNIDFIQANSITVNKLAADVGSSLDLSSNKSIKIIVEDINKKIEDIDTSLYHADIASSGTSITRDISCIVITAKLLNGSTDVNTVESSFVWKRVSSNTSDDATWNSAHKGKKSITITSDDLEASANFHCEVTTAEWSGKTSSITIVDELKSQVPIGHLTANQPDTQTLDESGNVTPVWGLTLTPSIQLGIFSPNIEDFATTWKRRVESGNITALVAGETVTNNVLSVNTNVLSNDIRSITYYCYIKYQYSTCMTEKTFTLVKDGSTGSDGVSIVRESTAVLYAVNSSNTVPPTNGWITTRPSRSEGQYIWQKMRIAYSDGTQTETDAACITGDKGDKGEDGLNGLQGPKGDQGIQGPIGATGKSSYTHIAYANSADGGTDFSVSDSNRTYVGMYVDSITTDSTDPTKYAWSKIKGADGAQGTPGKAGADGKTPYLHIAYANNATGTSGFSTTDSVNKLYIGQYTDFVSADSSDPTKYAWSKIKGETGATGPQGQQGLQGIQGPKGDQGVKGATGANGQTSYFHIKYSPVQNPTSAQMTETPSTYIGTYVDFIATDSTNPSAYTWTQFKGSQGPKGDQGIAGSNGSNGQTSYLHIAYSNSSDGSQGFSVSDANNKLYIGQYTDFLSADSTDYKKYSWTKIKGEDGTIKSSTEPSDKTKMWLDTSVTPNILKYWNGTLWVMANDQITDINGAVNNATNEINKTIEKTNEKVDKLNSSVSTITETVNKNSDSISETSKKVSELEQTVDGWKSSITKISTIEDKLTGAVMQKELSVYLRFYEESGSPVVNLGSSESKTQNFITNEGMRVEINGVMQTIINSAGLNTNQIITKKILFENNHAMYTNAAKQLIIQ